MALHPGEFWSFQVHHHICSTGFFVMMHAQVHLALDGLLMFRARMSGCSCGQKKNGGASLNAIIPSLRRAACFIAISYFPISGPGGPVASRPVAGSVQRTSCLLVRPRYGRYTSGQPQPSVVCLCADGEADGGAPCARPAACNVASTMASNPMQEFNIRWYIR